MNRIEAERNYKNALENSKKSENISIEAWENAEALLNEARKTLIEMEEKYPTTKEKKSAHERWVLKNRGYDIPQEVIMSVTTLNVHIGLKHYIYIPEYNEVSVVVPDLWDYSGGINHLKRKSYSLIIKPHTKKWYEVKSIAMCNK